MIAAQYNGVKVERPAFKMGEDNTKPEFLAKSPLGKVPLLETAEGCISESSAIARYIARLRRDTELFGRSFFESGQVDAWVDFCSTDVELAVTMWIYPILGYMPYSEAVEAKAEAELHKALGVMDRHLLLHTYFVGEKITLADIALASALFYPFKLVLDAEARAKFPNVVRWFVTCVNQPEFQAVLGDVPLAEERMLAAGATGKPKAAAAGGEKKEKADKPKKEKAEKPAKAEKAEAAPAAGGGGGAGGGGKAELDTDALLEAAEASATEKKKGPFDDLAPAKLQIDEFKRFYSNAPYDAAGQRDYRAVMPEFWEKLWDNEGYSIWFCNYKYNEENTMNFKTSNLVSGFIQRSDELRRYAFGYMHILNNEKPFEVTGCWLIRGHSIAPMLESNPDAEYYDWVRVDTADAAKRQLVEDYWCTYDTLLGKPVYDSKIFK